MGPYGIPPPPFRTSWDFSKPEDRVWTPGSLTAPTFDTGVLNTEATGADPTLSALWVEIDAGKFKTLEVKMKIDKPGASAVLPMAITGADGRVLTVTGTLPCKVKLLLVIVTE